MPTHRQTAKNFEKFIASSFKIKRISVANMGLTSSDCVGLIYFKKSVVEKGVTISAECKLRSRIDSLFWDALKQAENGGPYGALPIACVKRKGCKNDDSLVVMKHSDFKGLLQ